MRPVPKVEMVPETSIKNSLAAGDLPETVISSEGGARIAQAARELWAYRDLFRAFVARDVKVRYRQTALGIIWVVLQPLATAGVFSLVFSRIGAAPSEKPVDQLLFFLAGLIPWTAFASAVQNSALSMEANAHLITKVYFPRLVIPGAFVCASILDFCVGYSIFWVLAVLSGADVLLLTVLTPLMLLIQLASAGALGVALGALNAQYRDVKYVVPFLLQIGMLVVVPLPLEKWPGWARSILSFNPMSAVVETYRAALSGEPLGVILMAKGALVAAAALVLAVGFFRRREARMVDVL